MRCVHTMLFIFVTIVTTSSNWQGDMTTVFSYYFCVGARNAAESHDRGGGSVWVIEGTLHQGGVTGCRRRW